MLTDFQLKCTSRDRLPVVKLKCPGCGIWADLDDDQYNGRVSTLCDCGFHETHNFHQLKLEKINPGASLFFWTPDGAISVSVLDFDGLLAKISWEELGEKQHAAVSESLLWVYK